MSEASGTGQEARREPGRGSGQGGERPDGRRVIRPTPGERARTLAYGVADGVLAVPGVPYAPVPAHVTDPQGRPLLLMPAGSAAAAALRGEEDLPATLRISDVAPVPLADRVRGRAWLHGWITEPAGDERREAALRLSRLHPRPELLDIGPEPGTGDAWTVLTMEVAEVEVGDAWGTVTLDAEEYAAGTPDPLVAIEAGILTHLDECHRGELVVMLRRLNRLAAHAASGPDAGGLANAGGVAGRLPDLPADRDPVVRPLGIDRYGMWLRCFTAPRESGEPADLRVVFGEPVSDIHGLRRVYRRLFAGVRS